MLQLLIVEVETLLVAEFFPTQPQPQLFSGLYFPKDSPGPVPVTDDAAIIILQKKVGVHARDNFLLFLFMHIKNLQKNLGVNFLQKIHSSVIAKLNCLLDIVE